MPLARHYQFVFLREKRNAKYDKLKFLHVLATVHMHIYICKNYQSVFLLVEL